MATKTQNRKRRSKRRSKKYRMLRIKRACVLGVLAVLLLLIIYNVGHHLYIALRPKADETTFTLKKDGSVRLEELVDTNQLDTSKSELKGLVKDDIDAFNERMGENKAKFIRIGKSNGKTYVETTYTDVESYAKHTKYDVKLTDVKKSKEDFNAIFVSVKDNKKGKSIPVEQVKRIKGKVLTIDENIAVKVPGEIVCVSDEGTTISKDGVVSVKPVNGNYDSAVKTYIIYK